MLSVVLLWGGSIRKILKYDLSSRTPLWAEHLDDL